MTDGRGNKRSFGFTTQFGVIKPTAVTGSANPTGSGSAFTYDSRGFVSSRTDLNGNVTIYTHDARGNQISRTEAYGTSLARNINTTWHPTFHLATQIVRPGRITAFAYDALGNLLSETVTGGGLSRSHSYTYNAKGQVLTATDPRGNVTKYAYASNGTLANVTNALGHLTSFTAYDGAGRLLRSVDANGVASTFNYDARGRLTTRKVGTLTTKLTYDNAGNLIKVTKPDGSFYKFSYDGAHQLVGIADALGNRIADTLDKAGNLLKEQVFDPADVQKRIAAYQYRFQ